MLEGPISGIYASSCSLNSHSRRVAGDKRNRDELLRLRPLILPRFDPYTEAFHTASQHCYCPPVRNKIYISPKDNKINRDKIIGIGKSASCSDDNSDEIQGRSLP